MAKQPPALSMSSLIANDAPLLSPVAMGDSWDQPDSFAYPYYMPLSPASSPDSDSPVQPAKILKMRMSPDASQEQESLCLPTSQVFDLSDPAPAPAPVQVQEPAKEEEQEQPLALPAATAIASTGSKRSASPTPGSSKKRATERVSSKDFVPPDVTGLSKREARLVKNRAAAFLSRQRKREEFETMEVRVAELEQENARLLALTQSGSQPKPQLASDPALLSEVEQLRAQLAAAEERERELAAKLVSTSFVNEVPVKVEASESYVPPASPSSRSLSVPSANKTAASLGLMVLLCALPTLLSSVQMQTSSQTSFSVPTPFPSAAAKYDFSNIVPSDFDWTRSSLMNMDAEDMGRLSPSASLSKKLEFADVDMTELGDLNGLDISFDTSSTDNGKIRVRIHPSSSASSRAASPGASSQSSKYETAASSPMDMWSTDSESTFRSSFSSQGSPAIPSLSPSSSDPFLGDFSMPDMSYRMNDLDDGPLSEFGLSSEYNVPDSTGGKRRVRIALKNPPSSNTEGGEWEVEIC
ncbi:hypothetical protein EST38_g919 [Candolleomyces aberdarensis]|uniref:BZIP domain-containing protein n=1 Tax=Candolleomyces aberdarensis TaxID=2316362 RepID=A0A4V1Q5B2_9AGAR|nr:hypothetical protein EST38_g919 [Candolleomyces aberdarensis]